MPDSKLLPPRRPHSYPAIVPAFETACGKIYITVSLNSLGYPVEVFARMGKVGGCASATLEAVARSISVALRCGVDASELASQYIGITCTGGSWDHGVRITSCVSAIGLALQEALVAIGIKPDGTVDEGYTDAPPSLVVDNIPGAKVNLTLSSAVSEPARGTSLVSVVALDADEVSAGDFDGVSASPKASENKEELAKAMTHIDDLRKSRREAGV